MSFYKLFYILHRRTDYDSQFESLYYYMHPEKAIEKARKYQEAVTTFAMTSAILAGVVGNDISYFKN